VEIVFVHGVVNFIVQIVVVISSNDATPLGYAALLLLLVLLLLISLALATCFSNHAIHFYIHKRVFFMN
jgi:hypothetical protein